VVIRQHPRNDPRQLARCDRLFLPAAERWEDDRFRRAFLPVFSFATAAWWDGEVIGYALGHVPDSHNAFVDRLVVDRSRADWAKVAAEILQAVVNDFTAHYGHSPDVAVSVPETDLGVQLLLRDLGFAALPPRGATVYTFWRQGAECAGK
jgi:hypothetical protein